MIKDAQEQITVVKVEKPNYLLFIRRASEMEEGEYVAEEGPMTSILNGMLAYTFIGRIAWELCNRDCWNLAMVGRAANIAMRMEYPHTTSITWVDMGTYSSLLCFGCETVDPFKLILVGLMHTRHCVEEIVYVHGATDYYGGKDQKRANKRCINMARWKSVKNSLDVIKLSYFFRGMSLREIDRREVMRRKIQR